MSRRAETLYYAREGRFIDDTLRVCRQRIEQGDIHTLVIMTLRGDGALRALELFRDSGIRLVAASFPVDLVGPWPSGITDQETIARLISEGATICQGPNPLWEIRLPGQADPKLTSIRETLKLFGFGALLCVEAVAIACDHGAVSEGEVVVACSADTAIVARAAHAEHLFSPSRGLEIREVLCKPEALSEARKAFYTALEERLKATSEGQEQLRLPDAPPGKATPDD